MYIVGTFRPECHPEGWERNISSRALAVDRPIFVLGPRRSGTTLLRSLLAALPRVAITPETHFMSRAETWGLEQGAPADLEHFRRDFTAWTRFRALGVGAGRCRELIEMQGDRSFQAIFRAVLIGYGERERKPRIGEKTPGHTRFLTELIECFPDVRILVNVRDPRAVVASQLKTPYVRDRRTPRSLRGGLLRGEREREIVSFARNWTNVFQTRLAAWHGEARFFRVIYERLVQDPERELRGILSTAAAVEARSRPALGRTRA